MEQISTIPSRSNPGGFPPVRFSGAATRKLKQLVLEQYAAPPRRGLEIGGILVGRRRPSGFDVDDCVAVPIEHRNGASYTPADSDWLSWQAAMESIEDTSDDHHTAIGFFRSHTRPGLQPDPADSRLSQHLLPGRQGIFLLLKPLASDSVIASLFLSEGGVIADEFDAPREIPFGSQQDLLDEPDATPARPAGSPQSRILRMPSQPGAETPSAEAALPDRKRRLWVPATAVLVGIASVVTLNRFGPNPEVTSPSSISPDNPAKSLSANPDERAIKSPSDSSSSQVAEKPENADSTSSVAAPERRRMVSRGNRTAHAATLPEIKSADPVPQPGRIKRFFRGVGSRASRIWPFRSNKPQEQNQ